ncbi:MAG: PQQ-binding-like beta-propeller repeat protein [Treponema sp.]|nr:PQQ-binding-like beta-propeller repeat protein [Treponema sp.]
MNRFAQPYVTMILLFLALLGVTSCSAGKNDEKSSQNPRQDFSSLIANSDIAAGDSSDGDAAAADSNAKPESIQPVLVFIQGSVSIKRDSQSLTASEGLELMAGDTISTGKDGSAEIAYGSFATIRLFPNTTVNLTMIISRAMQQADHDTADLSLLAGTVAAKVKKLSSKDEFLVLTPNSAAGVRGTQFIVGYEKLARTERTLVAVREGSVAVLPKGKLFTSLIDGRQANPLAGAVVATAFTLAPKAGPGQEITVGGQESALGAGEYETLLNSAESAYGSLVHQAEELQARGTDFEAVRDPAAVLAGPDSEAERSFAKLNRMMPALLISEYSRTLLEVLDRMRDPGKDSAALPAALPERYFAPQSKASSDSKKVSVTPNYQGLVYSVPLASTAFTGMMSRTSEVVLLMDSKGNLYAVDQQGKKLYERQAVVSFTALDTTIAVVEQQKLTILDANTGRERGFYAFDSWQGLPQAKPVPVPNGLALATPRGVTILRQENAEVIAEIPVLGGVIAPLVLAEPHLVAVSGQGKAVFIDLKNARILDEIAINLSADVLSPRVKDGRVYIAAKSGRVVAIDAVNYRMLWDVKLDQSIRSDPELDGGKLYVWLQDKTLRSISLADGTMIGAPIPNVESPPLLSKGKLYWSSSGPSLVIADAASGAILKRSPLPEVASARPILVDGNLYIGTANGKLLRIDTDKL